MQNKQNLHNKTAPLTRLKAVLFFLFFPADSNGIMVG